MSSYVLGHSDQELHRLTTQARLVGPVTRQLFRDAGIAAGMRVLDVGSGAGDVAFLAAELVGNTGEIVGVDRSAAALGVARRRAAERSLHNVSFREGDFAELQFERPFDAAVGRYVLMFQPDPAAMLRALAVYVRPGGAIAFHEVDWAGAHSFPPSPTYDRSCRWIVETVGLSGADVRMGAKLASVFVTAGLPAPSMCVGALIGGGENSSDPVNLVADLAGTLIPEMERLGVATAAEVGVETLAARMLQEAMANASVIMGRSEVGAWSRKKLNP